MKGNKIREVHWNIFKKIKIFDLSSNMLNGFKSSWVFTNNNVSPFTEHFIQVLLLSNNNISHLSNETFSNLSKLIKLDLSSNHLSEVGEQIFSDQKYLRILDLSKNGFSKLGFISFQHLLSIKILYLDYNHISHIDKRIFEQNYLLQVISLKGNRLNNMDINLKLVAMQAVANFSNLNDNSEILYPISNVDPFKMGLQLLLQNNSISHLSKQTFRHMYSLFTLDLSQNLLFDIKKSTFLDQIMLKSLLLRGNRLKKLYRYMFKNLDQVQVIDLDNNNIFYIEKELFSVIIIY